MSDHKVLDLDRVSSKLGINKIMFVDDQIDQAADQLFTIAQSLITEKGESEGFIDIFKGIIPDEIIEDVCFYHNFSYLEADEDLKQEVIDNLKEYMPLAFEAPAGHILKNLKKCFNTIPLEAFADPGVMETCHCELIIMDYDYQGQFTALDLINKLTLSKEKLYYIILLSSHETFNYNSTNYNMENSEERQDLFRKYISEEGLHFRALLNYINKSKASEFEEFVDAINNSMGEFEAGKLMYNAMKSLKDLLVESVEVAVKKLLLTNTVTLKALITDKLESEGVSETTYLVDFSLALVKNLVNEKLIKLKEIHIDLQKIQDWSGGTWDYETDKHMRNLRRIQLYDEKINERNMPIDFGDIFMLKINGKQVRGILISQSCDLTIRKAARKEIFGTIILEVSKSSGQSCLEMRIGNDVIVWDVRNKIMIPTCILDLASLNDDGQVKIDLKSEVEKKFTWSNTFVEHLQKVKIQLIHDFSLIDPAQGVYWHNGLGFPCSKDKEVVDFEIKRLGNLDYMQTASLLKLYMDIKTRVPLLLDPSDQEFKEVIDVKLNNEESCIRVYSKKKTFFIDAEKIDEILVEKGFVLPKNFKRDFDDLFNIKYRVSEQLQTKLLEINPMTQELMSQLGLEVDIVDETQQKVSIRCLFISKLVFYSKSYTPDDFVIKYNGKSKLPRIKLKKELLEFWPESPGVVLDKYINLTHPDWIPTLHLRASIATLDAKYKQVKETVLRSQTG